MRSPKPHDGLLTNVTVQSTVVSLPKELTKDHCGLEHAGFQLLVHHQRPCLVRSHLHFLLHAHVRLLFTRLANGSLKPYDNNLIACLLDPSCSALVFTTLHRPQSDLAWACSLHHKKVIGFWDAFWLLCMSEAFAVRVKVAQSFDRRYVLPGLFWPCLHHGNVLRKFSVQRFGRTKQETG